LRANPASRCVPWRYPEPSGRYPEEKGRYRKKLKKVIPLQLEIKKENMATINIKGTDLREYFEMILKAIR
jgi:hypothetical protein